MDDALAVVDDVDRFELSIGTRVRCRPPFRGFADGHGGQHGPLICGNLRARVPGPIH